MMIAFQVLEIFTLGKVGFENGLWCDFSAWFMDDTDFSSFDDKTLLSDVISWLNANELIWLMHAVIGHEPDSALGETHSAAFSVVFPNDEDAVLFKLQFSKAVAHEIAAL